MRIIDRLKNGETQKVYPFTTDMDIFAPNPVGTFDLPRTIGRIHGCDKLTILSSTLCTLFSSMYLCWPSNIFTFCSLSASILCSMPVPGSSSYFLMYPRLRLMQPSWYLNSFRIFLVIFFSVCSDSGISALLSPSKCVALFRLLRLGRTPSSNGPV